MRGLAAAGIAESLQQNSALARLAPTKQTASLVSDISRFVVNTRYDAIPLKALETAKTAILDSLGVAVVGGTEESAQITGKLVREERAKEETTIYGQHFKGAGLGEPGVFGTGSYFG